MFARTNGRSPQNTLMPVVERVFSQIQPVIENQDPLPFSAFWGRPAVIVLGDPGAGKTTSFREASQGEPESELVSVRDFLALSIQRWRGKTLYLDGLDEQRAKTRDGSAVLDRVRARLDQLSCPSFRLSCRAADWYGSSDADRLRLVSSDGSVSIVRLEPLSDENIQAIASEYVSNPVEFLDEARNRQVYDLLQNPQTLKLLLTVVQQGVWPSTRTELYQRACEILSLETNPEHTDFQGPSSTSSSVIASAGHLCAVHLCGGTVGFALTATNADIQFPFIGELVGDREILPISARRRIFQTEGPSRIAPIHRTVAEYLAGQFLVTRIRAGLPLQRVLALIAGNDGGTLSDLRGLYAWISCLLTEHAGTLIPRDPLGIILYGDASALTLSTKQLTLRSLAQLADENPWFRSEDWSSKKPFGGLASPDMEPFFREVLGNPSAHPVFLHCVFDAMQYGSPMPQLGDLVLGMARDNARDWHIRSEAIPTFEKICPDRTGDFLQLLDDIHSESVTDPERELRGDLLRILYPLKITPDNILRYITQENEHHHGSYTRFLGEELVPKTPTEQLPLLVESLGSVPLPPPRDVGFIWKRFVGRLILALVSYHGESATLPRLYDWLGCGLDKYKRPIADRQESTKIQTWLREHPAVVRGLYKHWISITPFSRPRIEIHDFWTRLYDVEPPGNFPQWLLELANQETREEVSKLLFRQAVHLSFFGNRSDSLSLEELFSFVDIYPQFWGALEEELLSEIPEWRRENAVEEQQRNRAQVAIRAERIQGLTQQADLIRTGSPSNPLVYLAKLFYGNFIDIDRQLPPDVRLVAESNEEIASQAKQGFIAALTHPRLYSPREIGEAHAESKIYEFGFPVLAGMDVLAAESIDRLLRLPSQTLQAAIAFHFAHILESKQEWVDTVFKERPVDCAKGLISFLNPHFKHSCKHIPAIHKLSEPDAASVARLVLPSLLKKFPLCSSEHLEVLLSTALRVLDKTVLLRLTQKALKLGGRAFTKKHQVLWNGIAFALAPNLVSNRLSRLIGSNIEQSVLFFDLLFPERHGKIKLEISLAHKEIVTLITIFGRIFRNQDLSGSGWLGLTNRGKGAERVRYLINRLKADPSSDSTEALTSLYGTGEIAAGWREYLQFALSEQARLRRETTFRYPTVPKVVRTLSNQQPANSADLQAVIMDHLRTLREDLRHGPTDGYKTFWNVDHHGRPTQPKPENECRDRLLDLLRPKLVQNSINAEPEGHYAQDKRADIKTLFGQLNLPIEIKGHWHKDLWIAPRSQLRTLYSRDPGTQGRGIYLVFWFGLAIKSIPRSPDSFGRAPTSPAELGDALTRTLSAQEKMLIEIIVVDCSPQEIIRRKRRNQRRSTTRRSLR
jgi:hypothetical protein